MLKHASMHCDREVTLNKISIVEGKMEELRNIFGEESINYDTFMSKVSESGIKLVNLKTGGYVDKNKYEKLQSEFEKYKSENDVSKYSDYEDLKSEVEQLKAEKAENELYAQIAAANVDDRFKKFVLSEVKQLVSDEKDFQTALNEYIQENAQFVKVESAAQNIPSAQPAFRFGSQENIESGGGKDIKLEKLDMKEYIEARKKM